MIKSTVYLGLINIFQIEEPVLTVPPDSFVQRMIQMMLRFWIKLLFVQLENIVLKKLRPLLTVQQEHSVLKKGSV